MESPRLSPERATRRRHRRYCCACRNLFKAGWGYQTEHILRNAVAALIAAENTSLLCIRRLLIDGGLRASIPKQVTDPLVLSFWHDEFDAWEAKFRRPAIAPLLN